MGNKRFYQPTLLDRQIRALYWLKEATGLPMTHHAQLAVDEYLARVGELGKNGATGDRRED